MTKIIVFDEAHNQHTTISDDSGTGFSKFAELLTECGYTVRSVCKEEDYSSLLKDADVFVISFPTTEFSDNELKTIKEFVERGKGLLLVADWGNIFNHATVLNKIASMFGILFNDDRIADTEEFYNIKKEFMGTVFEEGARQFIKITNLRKHPITEGICEIGHYAGCSLAVNAEKALTFSSTTSFSDTDGDNIQNRIEKSGGFITSAFTEHYAGRVVGVGDTSKFSNEFIDQGDNKIFALNIIEWLAKGR